MMIDIEERRVATTELSMKKSALQIRCQQAAINDLYCAGQFRVPIHLAFGHEPIAVGLANALGVGDQIVLSHRNLHYQLALGAMTPDVAREFFLQDEGLAGGRYGSMNLVNPVLGVTYTSSILGNNLSVAIGVALASAVREESICTWVVTGDGALEEGAFAESLLLSRTTNVPLITIIEDNGWSLATSVEERRSPIFLDLLVEAYGVCFLRAEGKGIQACFDVLQEARSRVVAEGTPVVVHVPLDTLGGRWIDDAESLGGRRFINYHAGPAKGLSLSGIEDFVFDGEDPLAGVLAEPWASQFIEEVRSELRRDLSWITSLG